ncbi:MAG: hypothetical protein GC159_08120 [Phycisphaera sp.]|nr:hypothetical protein [Phycisphaera sp.]
MARSIQQLTDSPPWPERGDWLVLHTRSRQEKVVAEDLLAMDIPFFLPLIEQPRFYGKKKRRVRLPMFPGYLFLRGDKEQAYRIDRTRRVAQIIEVADQAALDAELHNIHLAVTREAPLDPYPYLREGMLVEVRSGPFKGLRGIIEQRTSPDRLHLQVDMLGAAVGMEIDAALLEPVE